ncbi:MAG: leucyl aminopeptidase, partial [Rhodocyclaceae bacterium]
MEFSIKSGSPEKQRSACVVVGVFESRKLTLPAELLDKASGGYISDIVRRGDMEGKAGSTLLLHNVPATLCDRILLVGLGKEKDFREKEFAGAIRTTVKVLNETGAFDASIFLTELTVRKRSIAWRVRQTTIIALDATYKFDQFKSKKEEIRRPLRKLTLSVERRNELAPAEEALAQGIAIAEGMAMTKTLGNLPPNICHPTYLAEQAQAMAKEFKLDCEILDRDDMEKLGMGSLLSVARGSHQPPKLIVLSHQGGKAGEKPVVLVGKGVTFDTGGISLKPGADMDEMKYDMCGAASVLGTMRAVARMALPINLTVVVPATENMPGGNASRPGDIVTSMSGQTIEILNTDAEKRHILSDALTYAERFKPETVIDVATLTGACVIALGHVATG